MRKLPNNSVHNYLERHVCVHIEESVSDLDCCMVPLMVNNITGKRLAGGNIQPVQMLGWSHLGKSGLDKEGKGGGRC